MPVAAPADKRFRRAQVKPARRRRSWLARTITIVRVAATLACFLGGAYLTTQQVAHASALHVQRIVVRGNVRLSTGDVLALLEGLRGEHVLKVDLHEWQRRLLASPWVEYASLRRVLPSTVEVSVRERQPIAIARLRDELYLIDREGHVIDDYGPNYAQFDLPIVDGLASTPSRGEPLVDGDRAELAGRVIDALRPADALYRRVSQIDVSDEDDAVVMLNGDRALLHLGGDRFAERLQSYVDIAQALHQQVADIEYVDLRFEGRVYVRPVHPDRGTGTSGTLPRERRTQPARGAHHRGT